MLNDLALSGISPVKSKSGMGRNKAGRLVFRARMGERPVKVYEAANAQHAAFIRAVSRKPSLEAAFPHIIDLYGPYVIADWVIENGDKRIHAQDIASLLFSIHQAHVGDLPEPNFDYWHDFIRPRFAEAATALGQSELAHEISCRVSKAWQRGPRVLMHPDVTLANLICTSDGEICVIDNELLTVGALPLLDLCNAASCLNKEQAQMLFNSYLCVSATRISSVDIAVLEAAWLARRVGTAYVAKNLRLAKKLIEQYKAKESVLPVSF